MTEPASRPSPRAHAQGFRPDKAQPGGPRRSVTEPGSPADLDGPRPGTNPDGVTPTELPQAFRRGRTSKPG